MRTLHYFSVCLHFVVFCTIWGKKGRKQMLCFVVVACYWIQPWWDWVQADRFIKHILKLIQEVFIRWMQMFSSLPNCLVCCFCCPAEISQEHGKYSLFTPSLKLIKCILQHQRPFPLARWLHSQRPLLIVHLLSIAKHVGQINQQQQLGISERCLHAADGSLLISQVQYIHLFFIVFQIYIKDIGCPEGT